MLMYPQLLSGALAQFPLRKRIAARTVVNLLADGASVKLADKNGGSTSWQLEYSGLSDGESSTLQQFFQSCEGSLNGFTFLDPAGNLLAWSEDLENAVWQRGPFLSVSGGVADPFGGAQAFSLLNSGAAAQSLTQTLNAPAAYVYSFSAYIRAAEGSVVTLSIGASQSTLAATSDWKRVSFTASGDPAAESLAFAIACPPGSISIFGPQVEAQPAPSPYKKSSAGGVYVGARFQSGSLRCICTAPNQNSVTVRITYADHF